VGKMVSCLPTQGHLIGDHSKRGKTTNSPKDAPMAGTYTQLLYHLIFSTKRREPLISPRLQPDLYDQTRRLGVRNRQAGQGELVEMG